jgi:hypothetical protein
MKTPMVSWEKLGRWGGELMHKSGRKSLVIGLLVLVSALFLVGCANVVPAKISQQMVDFSKEWFKQNSNSPTLWQMNSPRVFGLCKLGNWTVNIDAQDPSKYTEGSTCWVRGKDASGKMTQVEYKLTLFFSVNIDKKAQFIQYTLGEAQKINFWKQLGMFALWGAVVFPLVLLGLFAFAYNIISIFYEPLANWLVRVGLLLALLFTGPFVAYYSYGTAFGAILGGLVYYLIVIPIYIRIVVYLQS